MKRLSVTLFALMVLSALPAMAQTGRETAPKNPSTEVANPTPEMWLYEQYRQQYNDPKVAVRRNAEFKAHQRANRLASMRWFGFSNSRPKATSDPYHGQIYSPAWTGPNPRYPFRWQGGGYVGGTTFIVPAYR